MALPRNPRGENYPSIPLQLPIQFLGVPTRGGSPYQRVATIVWNKIKFQSFFIDVWRCRALNCRKKHQANYLSHPETNIWGKSTPGVKFIPPYTLSVNTVHLVLNTLITDLLASIALLHSMGGENGLLVSRSVWSVQSGYKILFKLK